MFNEETPRGGWKRYYRNKAIKETAQQVFLLIMIAALYIFGCQF